MKRVLFSGDRFVTAPIDRKAQKRLEDWLRERAGEIEQLTGVDRDLLLMPTFERGFWASDVVKDPESTHSGEPS